MTFADLVTEERFQLQADIGGRREVILALSRLMAAGSGVEPETIADALGAREKLGSTAIGKGVAIPHAKHEGIGQPVVALITLAEPVAFAAPDDEPVDIVIGILAPQDGGDLAMLSQLVKHLRSDDVVDALRAARVPADAARAFGTSA